MQKRVAKIAENVKKVAVKTILLVDSKFPLRYSTKSMNLVRDVWQYTLTNKVKSLTILSLFLIVAALPLMILVSRQQQDIRQQASLTLSACTPTATTFYAQASRTGWPAQTRVTMLANANGSLRYSIEHPFGHMSSTISTIAVELRGPGTTSQQAPLLLSLYSGSTRSFSSPYQATKTISTTALAHMRNNQTYISIGGGSFSLVKAAVQCAASAIPSVTPLPTAVPTQTVLPTITPSIQPTVIPTNTPTPTVLPTSTPTPVPPSPTPSLLVPTPTPIPQGSTVIPVELRLHGLGKGGDSVSPTSEYGIPNTKTRSAIIMFADTTTNTQQGISSAELTYSEARGIFTGPIVPPTTLAGGTYNVTVTIAGYLSSQILAFAVGENGLLITSLVTGDIDQNGVMNIGDYNILIGCYSSSAEFPPKNCTPENKTKADLTDDGNVNQYDLNLWLREFSIKR